MNGTDQPQPRCVALEGTIGESVRCAIHPRRSSSCREFDPSYADGVTPNPRCDQARARWGMAALSPEDWRAPTQPLRPAA
jgi:Fe-S-cluster containining protein